MRFRRSSHCSGDLDLTALEQLQLQQAQSATTDPDSLYPPVVFQGGQPAPSSMDLLQPAHNEHGDGYYLDGHRHGYGLSPGYNNDNGTDNRASGAVQDEGLEAAAAAAAEAAVAAAVARGHQLRASGAFNFLSAPSTPVGMPLSAAAAAQALPSGLSFFPGEEAGAAARSRRNQLRPDSDEAAPLKQTVVATVAGSPDVSSEGVPLGEGFDGRVRLLGQEKRYNGPARAVGAGRGGGGHGRPAWNNADVAALAAAKAGVARAVAAAAEGVGVDGEALGWAR